MGAGAAVATLYVAPVFSSVTSKRAYAAITPVTGEGCTPGFWSNKNGAKAWQDIGIDPATTDFHTFFNVSTSDTGMAAGLTFTDILPPGSVVSSIHEVYGQLAFHAVAAIGNANHPDVAYPLNEAGVKTAVKTAYEDDTVDEKDVVEALKNQLDGWNNLGSDLCDD